MKTYKAFVSIQFDDADLEELAFAYDVEAMDIYDALQGDLDRLELGYASIIRIDDTEKETEV